MPGAFENFPYTNFHELNLDWIIEKLKEVKEVAEEAYTEDNPPPYPVTSVNGETGAVSLYAVNNGVFIRFPDASTENWNIFRSLSGTAVGVEMQKNGALQRINGDERITVYDSENQPPYPVTSVNGATGAVVLYSVAESATGVHIELPEALTKTGWSLRRFVEDNTLTGINFNKNGAMQRINGNYLYTVYDQENQPPYPVTSVNGLTGAVVTPFASYSEGDDILSLSVPSTEVEQWGISRTVGENDTLQFRIEHNNGVPEMYIVCISDGTEVEKRLLSSADIPSSSGVVSINGETGILTLNGTNLYYDTDTTLNQAIDNNQNAIEGSLAVVVNGTTAPSGGLTNNQLIYHNNKLYRCTSAISEGETITNYITEEPSYLNTLNNNIANLTTVSSPITFDTNYVGNVQYNVLHKIGRLVILQLNFGVDTAIPNNTVFATINSTYAPKIITCAVLATFDSAGSALPVRINTSGQMYHDMYGSSDATFYSGQIVYFV